jgi:biopolymer transport protein ExbD
MQATAGGSSRKRRRLLTEINMVPFIDIVLVLLIIFMVVSPFLAQSEMPIRLPQALSGTAAQADQPLTVRVTKDGDYYLAGKRVLRNDVETEIKTALQGTPGRAVMIEADRDTGFKSVVTALDAAERAGAAKVGVAVENTPQ